MTKKRENPAFVEDERRSYRERHRRRRHALEKDPIALEAQRDRYRRFYEENSERILSARKEHLSRLTPEEFEMFREGMRAAVRRWQTKWRTELEKRPDLKQAYLKQMAEYRRRRRIARFMAEAAKLGDFG